MRNGILAGVAAALLAGGLLLGSYAMGLSSTPSPTSALAAPTTSSPSGALSTRVDSAPTDRTSEHDPRTASPTDSSMDAVDLAPPMDGCLAYAPGHGRGASTSVDFCS
jgi:hypothetical protein